MPLNEAQVVATELEKVKEKIPTLFDRDDVFYSDVEKRDVEVISSRDMRVPLELRPGGYFGHYNPDGGDLGLGGGPTYDKAVVNTVHFKFGVHWTKKAEWSTDDKRKAVINILKKLLATSMQEFRRQVDGACMTAGNGVIGTITSYTGTGPYVATLNTDGYGARLIRHGQQVNVYSADLATNLTSGAERSITLVDIVNKKVTIGGGAIGSIANGCKIVLSGLDGATPTSLLGVPYHHNNATSGYWLGFDRAATPEVVANGINANGAFALPYPRLIVNRIRDRVGINSKFRPVAYMHPCQKQAYEEMGQLVSVINKSAKDEGLDLYFGDNMQLAGCPIKESMNWDKTRIDFIIRELWGRAEYVKPGFYEVDGRKIFELRGTSGGVAASQIFYLISSFNLFHMNPAAAAYIYGLTVPSGY